MFAAVHLSTLALGVAVAALLLAFLVMAQPDERAVPTTLLLIVVVALSVAMLIMVRRHISPP